MRSLIISVSIAISFSLVFIFAENARADECSDFEAATTGCLPSIGIGEGGVDLGGSIIRPGNPGAPIGSGPGDGGGGGGGAPQPAPTPVCVPGPFVLCRDGFTVTPITDPTEPGRGPITLADLVNFKPAAGRLAMEPSGWAIINLDANFYAEVTTQVQDNLLLGQPASVRFTPRAFRWNYGDGVAATEATAGQAWAAIGIAEFDPTATSHVYTAPGEVIVSLTIDFGAEYQFAGSPWIPIAGVVPVPAGSLPVTVGDAATVLVGSECTVNPRGPGC